MDIREIKRIAKKQGFIEVDLHAHLLGRDSVAMDILELLRNVEPPLAQGESIDILRDAEWWIKTVSIDKTSRKKERQIRYKN